MSVLQLEELVAYQLRSGYLNELADGVGERLFTLNEGFLNSAPFKAAGWRTNPPLVKRTHSPPIPTAIAAEYFQAPRLAGHTLEDGVEDDGVAGAAAPTAGFYTGGGGGGDVVVRRRRRRREKERDDDSSDLTDESDDDASSQRGSQQIRFAKVPVRNRAGSSPLAASTLRQAPSPRAATPASVRRGSHSALETVRETARRDTITSSEASDHEVSLVDDGPPRKHREAASRAAARAAKLQAKLSGGAPLLLDEEDSHHDDDYDSDATDGSEEGYAESVDSASILDLVVDSTNLMPATPTKPVVGTPPRPFTRRPTVRRSQAAPASSSTPQSRTLSVLPPPRPMSMIRPLSMVQPPTSLLSAALAATRHQNKIPFQRFAQLAGGGMPRVLTIRIYPIMSSDTSLRKKKPFEVLIRPTIIEAQGKERYATVTDLLGLSLYRYIEEKLDPPLPPDKLNLNWWTLRMIEDGEVDDDFPPMERGKPLSTFIVSPANNPNARGGGRARSNSKAYDEFALVQASAGVFADNQRTMPQEDEEVSKGGGEDLCNEPPLQDNNTTSGPMPPPINPILHTTFRSNATTLADRPQPQTAPSNATRGQQKILRIFIMSPDVPPGQIVTLDVTTDMYLAEVLDQVCSLRQLDKASHVLKLPQSGAVVILDRPVLSIGALNDLELYRRRFATDATTTSAVVGLGSPGSSSLPYGTSADANAITGVAPHFYATSHHSSRHKKHKNNTALTAAAAGVGPAHPLAHEVGLLASGKRYTVWRKQTMRIVAWSERVLAIDGEYIHILPSSGGKPVVDGKTTTVHFSNLLGCKITRRHTSNFKLTVYKSSESNKRYEFESKTAEEASEIVEELKRGIAPYREI